MTSWYSHSDNITLKDGMEVKQYTYVFETTEKDFALKVEKYFKVIIDEANKKIDGEQK